MTALPSGDTRTPIRVMIVEDQALLRQGLVSLLETHPDISVVAQTGSGEEALTLFESALPDVTLMDLKLPEMDGINAIRRLRERYPTCRILALTNFDEEERVTSALMAGALGYLLKNVSIEALAGAIRSAMDGSQTLSPEVTRILLQASMRPARPAHGLTEREMDVLALMASGLNNVQIARRLVVSHYTVKTHVSNILAKLDVTTRTEAVARAVEEGIVHAPGVGQARLRG